MASWNMDMAEVGRHLDLTEGGNGESGPARKGGRPSIQVWFACAGAYQRVFRAVQSPRYLARCPKCGKTVGFAVGQGGTSQRMFEVRC